MTPHVPAMAPNFLPSEKLTGNLQKLHSHPYGPSTGISTPDVNSHVLSSTRTPCAGLVQQAHAVLAASAQEQRSRESPAVGKAQPALLLWSAVLSCKRHPGGWKHPTSLTLARRGPGDGTAPSPVPQPAAGARQHRRPELEEALAEQRMATLGEHGASPEAHTRTEATQPAAGTPRGREPGGAPTSGPLSPPSARRPRPGPPRPAQAPPWRPRAAGRAEGAGGAPGPPLTWPSRVRGAAPAMLGGPGAAGAISAWRRPQPRRASRRARAQRRPRGSA